MNNLFVRWLISIGLMLIGIVLTWLGAFSSQVLMGTGIVILAFGAILSWSIRCPKCGRSLMGRRNFFLPRYCSHCGHKIEDSQWEETA